MNSEGVFNDVIKAIKDASKDSKMGKIVLKPKHIYFGMYNIDGVDYPVAIYGDGDQTTMTDAFTKIQVTDSDELTDKENIKHLYCDETYTKYFILAFYEDGKSKPTMIMQVEKFMGDDSKDKWLKYLNILKGQGETEAVIPITADLLKGVYPDVSSERLEQVAEVINKYSNDFGITTPERMSHFLGQIGTETSFKASEEKCLYGESRIKSFWGRKLKSCSLCNTKKKIKFPKLFNGYDENSSIEIPDSLVLTNNDNYLNLMINEQTATDFYLNYTTMSEYTNNCRILNYVYANILTNGSEATGDGYKFRGRGFIQVTGRSNYKALTVSWNKKYSDDPRDFENNDSDRDLIVSDVEVGMKLSLLFWDDNGLNEKADSGINDVSINAITKAVNGGYTHLEKRKSATEAFYNELKN